MSELFIHCKKYHSELITQCKVTNDHTLQSEKEVIMTTSHCNISHKWYTSGQNSRNMCYTQFFIIYHNGDTAWIMTLQHGNKEYDEDVERLNNQYQTRCERLALYDYIRQNNNLNINLVFCLIKISFTFKFCFI